ncbi:MAG: 2OG-Fe(II) oxygenase [Moritella sp.]|uniref:2OG-Fe(II) oxygenase n=1 Tax=Moritella sp. TaxID=78556 RepID=UPI0029A3465A|nr:2OG-Fe(II) oxygenase [Moritella sp.]MDX2319647.1 2OG-Fe(II) oxygenase [Moritella sp.]
MNRLDIANLIIEKITAQAEAAKDMYADSVSNIGYFYIDNFLPTELATKVHDVFPHYNDMMLIGSKYNLREYKYVTAQMNNCHPLLEETIFAFQDPRILDLIKEICDINSLYADENLYAGGISLMHQGQFLNPHLDNSHEKDRKQWRVLNLLYYVTPDWHQTNGGNLELWPDGIDNAQLTIDSAFNRLIVMATHDGSWHSVSPITADKNRTCVSNYYFSDSALKPTDQFHVTSFRGRPEQGVRDIALQADNALRQSVRKLFPLGLVKTKQIYKK